MTATYGHTFAKGDEVFVSSPHLHNLHPSLVGQTLLVSEIEFTRTGGYDGSPFEEEIWQKVLLTRRDGSNPVWTKGDFWLSNKDVTLANQM